MKEYTLNTIREKIAGIGDSESLRVIDDTEARLSDPYAPKAVLVSNVYGRQSILEFIGEASGQGDLISRCIPEPNEPFSLVLRHGAFDVTAERAMLGGLDFLAVAISIEWEMLDGVELTWYCGIPFSLLGIPETGDAGAICLISNATMALAQDEREWLQGIGLRNRSGSQAIISLYNCSAVNTRDDWNSLIQDLSTRAKSIETDVGICPSINAAITAMIAASKTDAAEKDWKRMQALNALDSVENRLRILLQASGTDLEALQKASDDMKRERKRLELSGRMISEGTVENMYTELRAQISEAIDQYNSDAYDSIRKRIETTKDVKQDVQSIQPYLQAVWGNFEHEIGVRLTAEQESITTELQRQIEQDGIRLVEMLGVGSAISYSGTVSSIGGDVADAFGSKAGNAKQKKLIARGMLITSIALAFVQPVLGLSALVGTQMYQHYQKSNNEDLRRQILNDLYSQCEQIKTQVLERILEAIETAKTASKKNIGDVYSRMLEEITAPALETIERIGTIRKQTGELQELLEHEIPAARGSL